jgi:hypothetical protein
MTHVLRGFLRVHLLIHHLLNLTHMETTGHHFWTHIETIFVTLQHKTSRMGQILEREILVLCDSVLQELSTNIQYYVIIIMFRIVTTEISLNQRNLRWNDGKRSISY